MCGRHDMAMVGFQSPWSGLVWYRLRAVVWYGLVLRSQVLNTKMQNAKCKMQKPEIKKSNHHADDEDEDGCNTFNPFITFSPNKGVHTVVIIITMDCNYAGWGPSLICHYLTH